MPDRIDRRAFLGSGRRSPPGASPPPARRGRPARRLQLGSAVGGLAVERPAATASRTATPKKGGTLVFGIEAEDQGFDPASARFDETGVLYARTVFDPLTIIAADGSVQPYLAQAVTPNADYTVWTITARPDVVFHDGTPCDAAAIAGSLNHFLDRPATASPFAAVKDIVGHERRHRRPSP